MTARRRSLRRRAADRATWLLSALPPSRFEPLLSKYGQGGRRLGRGRPQVIVNGRWLAKPTTGTGRYSSEVLRQLLQREDGKRIEVWVPRDAVTPDWIDAARIRRFRSRGQVFEQVVLPIASFGRRLVSMAGPAPLLKRKQLIVMHDATPFRYPETYTRAFALWYRVLYWWLGRMAKAVVTVSAFSARELAEFIGVDAQKFTVASPAATRLPPPEPLARPLPSRFFLTVGTLARHKNLAPVLDAVGGSGYPIVVVGDLRAATMFGAAALAEAPEVIRVGRVSDAELAGLYKRAVALIFPSLYEGFGLPVLEAQAAGCPVISSDRASLPEVLQDSAALFAPDSNSQLLSAVDRLWNSDAARARLIELGKANADRFDWARCANTILDRADHL